MSLDQAEDLGTEPVELDPPGNSADAGAFEVSVKGDGISVVRHVDQDTALSVIATLLGGGSSTFARSSPPVDRGASRPQTFSVAQEPQSGVPDERDGILADPRITVGEFIHACNALRYPAKITAIGYFLQVRNNAQSFTKDQVKAQFRPAGEALPGNFPRDFSDAISKRWLAPSPGDKDQYFVTNTGIAAIGAKFERAAQKAAPRRRTKSKNDSEQ
jgi:hypothetical protein